LRRWISFKLVSGEPVQWTYVIREVSGLTGDLELLKMRYIFLEKFWQGRGMVSHSDRFLTTGVIL